MTTLVDLVAITQFYKTYFLIERYHAQFISPRPREDQFKIYNAYIHFPQSEYDLKETNKQFCFFSLTGSVSK